MTLFLSSEEPSAVPELLGLWGEDAAAVAFDGQEPGLQVWRADLPAGTALAADRLAACSARLQWAHAQLSGPAIAAELAAFAEPVEFTAAGWLGDACDDLAGLAGRVRLACSPTALIETRVGDQLVGRSLVGLRGDVRTVLCARGGQKDALLHKTTVALMLSTRATLLRMVALITRAAPAIAVRLALPFGPLFALPVAWRAVQAVLSEIDRAAA